MNFSHFSALGRLSRRIYSAFLFATVVPTALAGAIGVYLSLQTLKNETLRNLDQEVSVRSQGIGRFFDQLSSELLYLANERGLIDVIAARQAKNITLLQISTSRLESDYAALARLYPHIYQIRLIAADGQEWVRIDRKWDNVYVVPRAALQSKGDRYYFREAMEVKLGQIYVSPLDLNVEFGKIEWPERPVIRVATPVAGANGQKIGVLIINLHADILMEQIQQMANARQGVAYLLDNQGHYVSRSADSKTGEFSMEEVGKLNTIFPAAITKNLIESGSSPKLGDGWIIAHAPINYARQAIAENSKGKWRIALVFPERQLFLAVFNLYLLYAVLFAALVVTALGGYALSRRLLRPLEDLSKETDAIIRGDFTRRVSVSGNDEIAALGNKFNSMAGRLYESSLAINANRDRLEQEVRTRTQELEHERASLAAVIEHTADGILAIDNQSDICLLNPAAICLLGGQPARPGVSLTLFWPQWPDIVRDAMNTSLRCDVQLPQQIISLAVTPTSAGFIVVARDVSRERAIQEERRELDRQMFQMEKLTTLGELAMGMAHEIGNPLAGMKAVAQAMQYEEDIPPGLIEALKRMEAEVDRLSDFLRSFHGFATPHAIHTIPCDLAHILDDVLFWTRKDAMNRGISFKLESFDSLPALAADPQQLKQVFLNLLMNAVHAMPEGGVVTVKASIAENSARIQICDTGVGIEPPVLNRIFEPFFTTRREGTGLGLAIVRKIVEQHGGTIDARSTPGYETCFSITWPLTGNQYV
ncbi:PAS domain-containing sensor histidine kinase [Undibacterium griseum]|uniref:histidine kinase n=1 Tax=Undibacterium griseum TaxID=2762295 RepID=A0ABR6YJT7_9BURK|nr:PAS domain-containing sensor histidine kinase [Undibacterium griseum]MBC3884119.1 HAMP domain-containing protein [Undibacterium griseum]